MTGRADLHSHTTASDGTLPPAGMVALARERGLAALGITDHDTVAGLAAAEAAGQELGVTVVPGVELGAEVPGAEVHILGYYCRRDDGALVDLLARLREGRRQRAADMVEKLRALGLPVTLEQVLAAGGESVGRPHVARALVDVGAAADIQAAFTRYLNRGCPAYVPRPRLSPAEAIAAVRDAGGVPVVAHPGLIRDDDWVRRCLRAGAMGLEAYHSDHTPQQCAFYADWARQDGLLCTGGSDSHGPRGARTVLPGTCSVDLKVVEQLRAAAGA